MSEPQTRGTTMTAEEILEELEWCEDGYFPRAALEEAMARPEEMTPHLLGILEKVAKDPAGYAERANYLAHVYAMYLLAQFRETRALAPILGFHSAPTEVLELLVDEGIIEGLSEIFASICGDWTLLQPMIEDESIDQFVRGAALRALVTLVIHDQLDRDEVISYYQKLYSSLERKESWVWVELVCCTVDLSAAILRAEIDRAFQERLVLHQDISPREVKRGFSLGWEKMKKGLIGEDTYCLINNAVESMEWWACFSERPSLCEYEYEHEHGDGEVCMECGRTHYQVQPLAAEKVGRNEPCPCGSGKKYKKCCGSAASLGAG